jgi:hypothetical protein
LGLDVSRCRRAGGTAIRNESTHRVLGFGDDVSEILSQAGAVKPKLLGAAHTRLRVNLVKHRDQAATCAGALRCVDEERRMLIFGLFRVNVWRSYGLFAN